MLDARRDPCGAVPLSKEVSRFRAEDDAARGDKQQLPPVGVDMQVAPCPGILPFIKGVNELCLINETGFVRPRIPVMLSQRHNAP